MRASASLAHCRAAVAPRTNGRKRKTDDLHQEEPEEASRLEVIAEDDEAAQASSQCKGSGVPLWHGSSSAAVSGGQAGCQQPGRNR